MNFNKILSCTLFLAIAAITFQNCKTDSGKGSEVTLSIAAEPNQLNIISGITQGYTRQVTERNIFAYLGDLDVTKNQFTCFLAKKAPEVNTVADGKFKGALAFTYEILDEAQWDNGTPVTAADMEFSLKTILNPKVDGATWRGFVDFIGDIQIDAANPKKFTIVSKTPFILAQETINNVPILPMYHYDPKGLMKAFSVSDLNDKAKLVTLANDPKIDEFAKDFNTLYGRDKDKVSGCGPYSLESWEAGQRLELKKKANWWGDKLAATYPMLRAYPERLIYKFSGNSQTILTDLKSGNLDVMATIPPNDYDALEKDEKFKKDYTLKMIPTGRSFFLMFNTLNPKFNDKRVRQAIAHAIDVDEIVKTLMGTSAVRMNTLILPTKAYHRKDLPLIPLDIAKAKQLLSEAGWKDSNGNGTVDKVIGGKLTEMTFPLLTPNKSPLSDMGILMQNTMKQAGIGVELITKDFNAIREEVKKKNFELTFQGQNGSTGTDSFEQKWHSKQGANESGFGNPSLDKLIEQINITLDEKARYELYGKFQGIIYDEQPIIMLTNTKERIAISKRFEDVEFLIGSPYYMERSFKVKK
jgi:peptide/nickel transport system substrate-binding protein